MASATDIPLTIAPEAAERVAELGLQREFEQMLEHARLLLPGLRRLEVTLAPPYDTGDEPRVIIDAFIPPRDPSSDLPDRAYEAWVLATFSPDVLRHILLMTGYEAPNGR
jgi:hypothetical protein